VIEVCRVTLQRLNSSNPVPRHPAEPFDRHIFASFFAVILLILLAA
jgi:hypothetical protein